VSRSTAILLVGYRRPELILDSIEKLTRLTEVNIVVSIDGPKTPDLELADEWQSIYIRFPSLRWKFRERNLGLAEHIFTAISEVLNEYQNCIVLEDDVQVDIAPLTETMKLLDSRLPESVLTVGLFGGMPRIPFLSKSLRNRWRITRYFSAWGWSIQREDWKDFKLEIAQHHIEKLDQIVITRLGMKRLSIWRRRFRLVAENPHFTWDYQLFLYSLILNKKHILPTYRTCDNLGFNDVRATNTQDSRPSWYRGKSADSISFGNPRSEKSLITSALQVVDSITWVGDQPYLQELRDLKRKRTVSVKDLD